MSDTSVGAGPGRNASNENHDGDPRNKTLGEKTSQQEPPPVGELLEGATPDLPAGVAGGEAHPDAARKAAEAFPDGPNVESSPWELEAARGHVPKP